MLYIIRRKKCLHDYNACCDKEKKEKRERKKKEKKIREIYNNSYTYMHVQIVKKRDEYD